MQTRHADSCGGHRISKILFNSKFPELWKSEECKTQVIWISKKWFWKSSVGNKKWAHCVKT